MESVPFSAGRIEKTTSGYDISYHMTDQVGSVRAVVNAGGEVLQQSDYYAFGLRHASTDFATNDNRYQLTGKESQKDFGFNYLDFHARQYDPTGILFTSQDPLQDKYMSIGSYNYCANNPIRFIDPDGKTIVDPATREVLWTAGGGWSENASDDVKRVGDAMMLSETGTEVWNSMAESDAEITITVSQDEHTNKHGNLTKGAARTTGTQKERNVDITIWEGSINKYISPNLTYSDTKTQEAMRKATAEERIGAIGTHEGTHATDSAHDGKREKRARSNQNAYLEEMAAKKSINK